MDKAILAEDFLASMRADDDSSHHSTNAKTRVEVIAKGLA